MCHTLSATIYSLLGGFPGGSVVKNPPANAGDSGDAGSIPGLGRCSGWGNGNPLQFYCLGDPMDRGAWQATVCGVKKEWDTTEPLSITHRCSLISLEQGFTYEQFVIIHIWIHNRKTFACYNRKAEGIVNSTGNGLWDGCQSHLFKLSFKYCFLLQETLGLYVLIELSSSFIPSLSFVNSHLLGPVTSPIEETNTKNVLNLSRLSWSHQTISPRTTPLINVNVDFHHHSSVVLKDASQVLDGYKGLHPARSIFFKK